MFGRTHKNEDWKLEEAIDKILTEMLEYGPMSPEYKPLLKQLERTMALRESKDSKAPSPDTMLLVGGNILLALVIVAYEKRNVWTSRAFSLIRSNPR